jgi:hypothetical protein
MVDESKDRYVVFWYNPYGIGYREFEEFDGFEEMQTALREWAIKYPNNRYIYARVMGTQEPCG